MTPEEWERTYPGTPFPSTGSTSRKTRTLYVREEDQEIWDQAKELAGESLSTFVTAQLKNLVVEKKAAQQGFEQLVIKFAERKVPCAKAFYGRWIIPPTDPFENWEFDPEHGPDNYAVALTGKNNIAVFNFWGGAYDPAAFLSGHLHVFDSVEHAANDQRMPDGLGTEIMRRLGVEVQVLDI